MPEGVQPDGSFHVTYQVIQRPLVISVAYVKSTFAPVPLSRGTYWFVVKKRPMRRDDATSHVISVGHHFRQITASCTISGANMVTKRMVVLNVTKKLREDRVSVHTW